MNNMDIEKLAVLREQLEELDIKINSTENKLPLEFAKDKIMQEIKAIEDKEKLDTFF